MFNLAYGYRISIPDQLAACRNIAEGHDEAKLLSPYHSGSIKGKNCPMMEWAGTPSEF